MRSTFALCLVGVVFVALAVPASGGIRARYTHAYYLAKNHHHADVGRNIRRDGLRDGVTAARRHYRKSIATLKAMMHPVVAHSSGGGSSSGGGGAGGDLASIRACESGGNYGTSTGNGFSGAYQFTQSTWEAAGGTGTPASASPAEQDRVAQHWIDSGHRDAWPNC